MISDPPAAGVREFPRDIEAEIPVVVGEAAARQLSHRRGESIGEVQLEGMTAGALFDPEGAVGHAWIVPEPRARPRRPGRPSAGCAARGEPIRTVSLSSTSSCGRELLLLTHIGSTYTAAARAERPGNRHAEGGRVAVAEVVGAIDDASTASRPARRASAA